MTVAAVDTCIRRRTVAKVRTDRDWIDVIADISATSWYWKWVQKKRM